MGVSLIGYNLEIEPIIIHHNLNKHLIKDGRRTGLGNKQNGAQ